LNRLGGTCRRLNLRKLRGQLGRLGAGHDGRSRFGGGGRRRLGSGRREARLRRHRSWGFGAGGLRRLLGRGFGLRDLRTLLRRTLHRVRLRCRLRRRLRDPDRLLWLLLGLADRFRRSPALRRRLRGGLTRIRLLLLRLLSRAGLPPSRCRRVRL
jgi:hypothetical protein